MLRPVLSAFALALALSSAAQAAYSDKTFTVSNTGNGALTVSGASISGNTTEYTLAGNTCSSSVAPGGSCAVTVRFTPSAVGVRPAATLTLNTNGTNGGQNISLSGSGVPNEITRTISANATNVNMAALFGNPTAAGNYVLTINAGVYVMANATNVAALTTGSFPAGSSVKIINNGYIVGRGGAGGYGGSYDSNNNSNTPGGPGAAGGPALALNTSVSIDNTSGRIYGGGGGGAGGWAYVDCPGCESPNWIGGHGGGGGQGAPSAPGGAGGTSINYSGTSGGSGNLSAPGAAGGTGASAGGAFGTASSGAAGKAVVLNGNTVNWIGGNNSTQVKGPVQ